VRDASGAGRRGGVILQNAPQLHFVEHAQVIKAFAPDRSDEALDVAVWHGERGAVYSLYECGWYKASPNARRRDAGNVALRPRGSVSYLTYEPLDCRIGSDADRDQPPASVTQDHQAIEEPERDRAYTF